MSHILVVEARFYPDIADELFLGAAEELERAGATYDRIAVPGVLEIPAVISFALDAQDADEEPGYDGYVALGTVIRGETAHFDIVANESARALMDLAVSESLAIGNGILTVENGSQAWARARRTDKNKGAGAAKACLAMIGVREQFEG